MVGSEQDVDKILSAIDICMSQIPLELKSMVAAIGICGQMHGVVFWRRTRTCAVESARQGIPNIIQWSRLYTWQDGRCSSEFMASLPSPRSHLRMATGFGCPTVFWLVRHEPGSLEKYNCAGTVQDFLVTLLCDLDEPVMTPQNAASWGYFDTTTNTWNSDILSRTDFPVKLLPKVIEAGQRAGTLAVQWNGISEGVPVTAAMGDLHCYVLSKLQDTSDAVINVGTSAQFTFLMPEGFSLMLNPTADNLSSPAEYVPYFDGRYLSETASLNGGNVVASFVTTLNEWLRELGLSVAESDIWEKVEEFVSLDEISDNPAASSRLEIDPVILGERHIPDCKTITVRNALPSNASLKNVCRSLSWGVIANLRAMSPRELPVELRRIVGSGGALAINAVMRRAVSTLFGLPLFMDLNCGNADSAVGAALAAVRYLLKDAK